MVGEHFDVAVVGAGPAGLATAITALSSGARVAIIEKEKFPRLKSCGCTLSHLAFKELISLGIELDDILWRGEGLIIEKSPFHLHQTDVPYFAVNRSVLDQRLLEKAASLGAYVHTDTKTLVSEDDGELVRLSLRSKTQESKITARAVALATGVSSAKGWGFPSAKGSKATYVGLSCFGVTKSSLSLPLKLSIHDWGYLGFAQIGSRAVVLSAAVRKHGVKQARQEIQKMCETLSLSQLEWVGSRGFPHHVLSRKRGRIFLIGDAYGYTHPFTGEGIGWALCDGVSFGKLLPSLFSSRKRFSYRVWELNRRIESQLRKAKLGLVNRALENDLLSKFALTSLKHLPALRRLFSH